MTVEGTSIEWRGPFSLLGGDNSVFSEPTIERCGLYLWAVKIADGRQLVYYVGIASKSVGGRLREHVAAYLGGEYWVYDPDDFRKGQKTPIYVPSGDILEFALSYETRAPKIVDFLNAFSIYFVHIDSESRWLMRLESGIIGHIKEAAPEASALLDNARRSVVVQEEERQLVNMVFPERIAGLGREIRLRV